ncbi:MAG: TRAP transporter large permease [Hyphomicrobium sp.]|uniref:TRAP transporter large permease n=1 Tax=Hyphomicrobium sp. CS1BSMeth3 TaxID=1892844 RepID=UPI0009306F56|nr:TRAP transporter large permease [Hyphomicrobium sp. CS1BSMeth3]MBN9261247.1 TRAP transporter large permease [Hyphomicrobium sp.]MBN9265630.1 TRAP transporter large permease [Hyphomicrobium sp.]
MTETQIGGVLLVTTLLVLFSGVPIAWGLTVVAIAFLLIFEGFGSLDAVALIMLDELASFALLTIPLFVLLGASIGATAAGRDIYESFYRLLYRVPGGLVIANIFACGVFSAICGSSPATAAAIGKVGVPEMLRRGVSRELATGSVCAGGTLGILIPPSVTLILYGLATETSIGRLFLAGVIPGILLVLLFAAYAWLASILENRERASTSAVPLPDVHFTTGEKIAGLAKAGPFLLILIAVGFFMYGGFATPSEVAAIAAVLGLGLVIVIYNTWRARDLWRIYSDTVRESTMILMIIAAAALYSYMLSRLYITQTAAEALVSLHMNRWVLMAAINVFLLVAGCFLPPVAIILMCMPVLTPVLEANNFDLIWFAIIMTVNLEIGLITPPVGLNLFVLRGVAPDIPIGVILRGSMPFVIIMLLFMVLMSVFPEIVTWLPDKVMGPGR